MLGNFYYVNNKLVTSINSYDIIIPNKILRHVIKLYVYAQSNDFNSEKYIIEDFLLTYYKTVGINKAGNKEYKKAELQYKKYMQEFNVRAFYKAFLSDCVKFYLSATTYGLKNNLYISPEVIKKMFNNIDDATQSNLIAEELLKDNKYCIYVINYDCNIEKHKASYLEFIHEILEQEHCINDINNIFEILVKSDSLTDNEIKEIINLYVKKSNNLCNKYKGKSENFTMCLSEIENLKNKLVGVLKINNLNETYKNKLHECIINILSLKRFLLLDEEYITSDMHTFESTTKIGDDKIKSFIDEIENNKFRIYGASAVDFDKCVEQAVEYYSKFALQSIISSYSIDSKTQTYLTNSKYTSDFKYSFEKYYEQAGENYTKANHSKLLNVMGKGYYVEMLRYLSRTFYMHQNITINILGEEKFKSLINRLKEDLDYDGSNDYSIIVGNILAIEVNINKALTKNKIEYTDNAITNLDLLFEKYKNNKTARNGIMYLYYSLYEHTGPNLRNKAMHGTLINTDLKIPLLISFCGLIFSCWLLSEK